ncbi:MAG: SLC13 family permease [candidate division WOR-3 bacterium]|uniref:PTS EIIA type-2 domain-containing protein n=1 Tax=candidate division WOR-3 bacterium TaxID=2052148 RepID=A0A7C3IWW5_UNCW3|nr:SLC13 family permease [candidate division WOR-3 bacterium]
MIDPKKFILSDRSLDINEILTQDEIFHLIARQLVSAGVATDETFLVNQLREREKLGSTGVGYGIALPHFIGDNINQPAALIVRLKHPVPWNSIDNEPVKLIVCLVAPEKERNLYLSLLAEIARSLNTPQLRTAALTAQNAASAARIIATPPHQNFLKRNRRLILFFGLVALIFIGAGSILSHISLPAAGIYQELGYLRFNEPEWILRQQLTITLFLAMVIGTLLFWRFRVAIAAAALGTLLIAGVMDLEHTVKFMSIPTILFIMSMMVIVRWLQNIGVFRFIVLKAIEQVKGIPWLLLLLLMAFSVILGGFADEVSAILVTFGLALEVSRRTKAPLVPFLLSLVFATNVGSALTLVGNPIGVYIAFAGGLSFEDFLRWATPVSAITAIIVALLCLILYRRHFFNTRYHLDVQQLEKTAGNIDPIKLRVGLITFFIIIILIALHRRFEVWLGLSDGTALVASALAVTGFIVFYEQEKGRVLVERGIDWWTLLFFMFLFANAACLEYTGVTTKLGYLLLNFAEKIAGTNNCSLTLPAALSFLWISGILSGFVDNLPIVAALAPVVKDLIRIGLPHASILWWALLFGGCFGGNLTVIGSTANLVAVGAFERASGRHIRFREWFKFGIIITAVTLIISSIAIFCQINLAP